VTRYWFDTEFIEDGRTIDLLSIGIVCEDGREYYAENGQADKSKANDWVKTNVLPHLTGRGIRRWRLRHEILDFIGDTTPEFWAYYGDYDWVALCQLFGTMVDLPEGWPMFAMDVKQLAVSLGNPRLPEQSSTEHHALNDARWTRDAWIWLAGPWWSVSASARSVNP
jgi:3'-5' exoribonuclease-like protein